MSAPGWNIRRAEFPVRYLPEPVNFYQLTLIPWILTNLYFFIVQQISEASLLVGHWPRKDLRIYIYLNPDFMAGKQPEKKLIKENLQDQPAGLKNNLSDRTLTLKTINTKIK